MESKSNDTYSLSHATWKCQYHIVFAPKYRRKVIYGKLQKEIGVIFRELCERKHVWIIERVYGPIRNKIKIEHGAVGSFSLLRAP